MSEGPLIFVSHSSKDNELTRQVCQALRGAGAGETVCDPLVDYEKLQNYDVLVDVDELQAGKPWPKQLHEWMARCHAAVLLLTSNAVKSPWVLKEATILAWRLSLDNNFSFFIVRFDDVSNADMTAGGFDPLMLPEIQKLTVGDAADIAAQVRKAVPPPTDTTPYKNLCDALEDLALDIKPHTLRRMAEQMGLGARQWQPGMDERQQYVQTIALGLLSENLGGYKSVNKLVNDLIPTTNPEIVKQILHIVAPHWVDAAAAGPLPSAATCEPRRAIAMNGVKVPDFTAEMYVRRAYPLSDQELVLPIPGGNSGNIVAHVTRELYYHAYPRSEDSGQALTPKQKNDVIEYFKKEYFRYFAVLSRPHPLGADLRQLFTDFPKLTFILWTEEELSNPEPAAVICLEPEVDLDEEENQLGAYEAAMEIIRRRALR